MSAGHVVIMGGSSGIGLATARQLLDRQFRVTILARSPQKLQEAKDCLKGEIRALAADARDTERVRGIFAELGAFHHLVLAASGNKGIGAFANIGLAEVRQAFEEKVFPYFACAQAALPHLSENGSITFVAAASAQSALPGTAAVGAANAAITGLVPILAAELKPRRVNAVSPGVVETHWWNFLPPKQRDASFAEYARRSAVGRNGNPDDIAQAIAFLISNGFVTGQVLVCDGGLSLGA